MTTQVVLNQTSFPPLSRTASSISTTPCTLTAHSGSQTADLLDIVGTTTTIKFLSAGTTITQTDQVGSDLAGTSIIFRSGLGTGTGAGGTNILRTNNFTSSGSSSGSAIDLRLLGTASDGRYCFCTATGTTHRVISFSTASGSNSFGWGGQTSNAAGDSGFYLSQKGASGYLMNPNLIWGDSTASNYNNLTLSLNTVAGTGAIFGFSTSRVSDSSNRPNLALCALSFIFAASTGTSLGTTAITINSSQQTCFGATTGTIADTFDIFNGKLIFSANSSTTKRSKFDFTTIVNSNTDASRKYGLAFNIYDFAGTYEGMRIESDGTNGLVGFNVTALPNVSGCEIGKAVSFSNQISDTISADQNDYSPTGFSTAQAVFVNGGAGNRNITGIVSSGAGRLIFFVNAGTTNNLVLKYNSGSSSAGNKIFASGSADYTLLPNAGVWLRYDGVASVWRVIAR